MYPSPNSPTTHGEESGSEVCTPPLVFSPNFVGGPSRNVETSGTPPMQPLQVCNNFSAYGSGGASIPRRSSQVYESENSPIRVKARTRDGRHSPYMAGSPEAGQMDLTNQDPYGFSYSGTSTPLAVSTPTARAPVPNFGHMGSDQPYGPGSADADASQGTGRPPQYHGQNLNYYTGTPPYGPGAPPHVMYPHTLSSGPPYHQQPPQQSHPQHQQGAVVGDKVYSHSSLNPAFELPAQVVHRALKGRCRFIAFPPNLPATPSSSGGANAPAHEDNGAALFIGQVRFETTPAELTWLVQRTCGAVASRLEGRGAGCYLLYCRGQTDLQLIRGLHKRVLFDIGGAWLARTPEEIDALCEYVALDAPLLSKKARLPRDSMVVEDLKLEATSTHRAGGGGGGDGNTPGAQNSSQSKRSGNSHGHNASSIHPQHARNINNTNAQHTSHGANPAASYDGHGPPRTSQLANLGKSGPFRPHADGSAPSMASLPEYGSATQTGPAPPPYGSY